MKTDDIISERYGATPQCFEVFYILYVCARYIIIKAL